MADLTVTELSQKIITRISQVPGTGVQLYSEDRIADMIQQRFDMIFYDYAWAQFQSMYLNATLDASTGVVTQNLAPYFKNYRDIDFVFWDQDINPLPEAPRRFNPATVTGTRGRFIRPNPNPQKLFQLLPLASDGIVHVVGRLKPDNFEPSTVVPFDSLAMILGVTGDYLEDDASNPGAAEKFNMWFEQRIAQLKEVENGKDQPLDARLTGQGVDKWQEMR